MSAVGGIGGQDAVGLGEEGVDAAAECLLPGKQVFGLEMAENLIPASRLDEGGSFVTPPAASFDDERDDGDIVEVMALIQRLLVLRPFLRGNPCKFCAAEVAVHGGTRVDHSDVNVEGEVARDEANIDHTTSSGSTGD
jgi:hypothetical protein